MLVAFVWHNCSYVILASVNNPTVIGSSNWTRVEFFLVLCWYPIWGRTDIYIFFKDSYSFMCVCVGVPMRTGVTEARRGRQRPEEGHRCSERAAGILNHLAIFLAPEQIDVSSIYLDVF